MRCRLCGVVRSESAMILGDGGYVCTEEDGGGRMVAGCRVTIVGERQAGDLRPDRCAACRWCGRSIERQADPNAPWATAKLGGLAGANTECPERPSGDGPTGEHEPGAPVVRPPVQEPTVLVEPTAPPPPVIPVFRPRG